MTEPPQSTAISAAYPAPPHFYKYFTEKNLEHLKTIQEAEEATQPAQKLRTITHESLLNLPSELRAELHYLVPPPPPPSGIYCSFSETRSLSAPLPPLPPETPLLIPNPPTPTSLLILTRSLLLSFLEYIHILSTNPILEEYGPKWEDLRDLFRNAHQAVNAYRPFQAREKLIEMLEREVERGKEEVRGVERLRERVKGVLRGLGGGSEEEDGEVEEKGGEWEEERRAWMVLEGEGEGW